MILSFIICFSKTAHQTDLINLDSSRILENQNVTSDSYKISNTPTTERTEENSKTTTRIYHGRSWFHHDIQDPKIRNLSDFKAKRDLSSTLRTDHHSTTESSSKIGTFFEKSWGSIRNGTLKVKNFIKEIKEVIRSGSRHRRSKDRSHNKIPREFRFTNWPCTDSYGIS